MSTSAAHLTVLLPCQMADPVLMAQGLCYLAEHPPETPEPHRATARVFAGIFGTTEARAFEAANAWTLRVSPVLAALVPRAEARGFFD